MPYFSLFDREAISHSELKWSSKTSGSEKLRQHLLHKPAAGWPCSLFSRPKDETLFRPLTTSRQWAGRLRWRLSSGISLGISYRPGSRLYLHHRGDIIVLCVAGEILLVTVPVIDLRMSNSEGADHLGVSGLICLLTRSLVPLVWRFPILFAAVRFSGEPDRPLARPFGLRQVARTRTSRGGKSTPWV